MTTTTKHHTHTRARTTTSKQQLENKPARCIGLCYKLTGGYVVDRTAGDKDCGGLGGMFGVVTALGLSLPFREGKPWQRSPAWEAFAVSRADAPSRPPPCWRTCRSCA